MELQKIYNEEKSPVIAFAESRIGGRAENQDSFGWQDTPLGYLVTVCDGMGGGPGGKTASSIAVREIITGIAEGNPDEEVINIIIKAVRRANMAIIEAGNNKPALKGMGSTATLLLLCEKSAFVAHVGDSRVYQLRGNRKVFRTFDHSMVFEMVSQGVITEEQARLSAQSNVITRALGIKPDIEVEVHELPYEKGDRFLLCTDGIHGTMPEPELLCMVTSRKNKLGAMVDDVATTIDNLGRTSGGGHDNLTLAVVETSTNSILRTKMSKQTRYIIAGLSIAILLSLLLNIVQFYSASNKETASTLPDTTVQSILNKDTIHTQMLMDIQEQVDLITSNPKNAKTAFDSIQNILKKTQNSKQ